MTFSSDQFMDDYQNHFIFNDVSSEDFASLSILSLTRDPYVLIILYKISRNSTFTTINPCNQEESDKGNEVEWLC